MAVVVSTCESGHPMEAKPLRAAWNCKGCGELCSTVYDCGSGCYGRCCDCWVSEVRDSGHALLPPAEDGG